MSAFGMYLIGFIVLAAGILTGAYFLGVGTNWLVVLGLVLAGLAIVTGVMNTKRRERPDA